MVTLACGSLGTANADTALVPLGNAMNAPPWYSLPFTVNDLSPTLLDAGTRTVSLYRRLAPLSAVIRTESALSPRRRPVAPVTTTDDLVLLATATTGTLVVPGATITTESGLAAFPSTVRLARPVSVEIGRTNRVTV